MAQAGVSYRRVAQSAKFRSGVAGQEHAARLNRGILRVAICLVMICLFVYISRMATIASGAKEISQIRQEIAQLKDDQQYLEVMLAARQDLDRVRDEAMGRLGMNYPAEGRVQMISLSGYVTAAGTQTAHEGMNP